MNYNLEEKLDTLRAYGTEGDWERVKKVLPYKIWWAAYKRSTAYRRKLREGTGLRSAAEILGEMENEQES